MLQLGRMLGTADEVATVKLKITALQEVTWRSYGKTRK